MERLTKLRELIAQAIKIRDASEELIAELNEQLHLNSSTPDNEGDRPERRKKRHG